MALAISDLTFCSHFRLQSGVFLIRLLVLIFSCIHFQETQAESSQVETWF